MLVIIKEHLAKGIKFVFTQAIGTCPSRPFVQIGLLCTHRASHFGTDDPFDRNSVVAYLREHQNKGQIVTGLLFVDETAPDMLTLSSTTQTPLVDLSFDTLNPGAAALKTLQKQWR